MSSILRMVKCLSIKLSCTLICICTFYLLSRLWFLVSLRIILGADISACSVIAYFAVAVLSSCNEAAE